MRSLKFGTLTSFIVVWSIVGFPLLALVTTALGFPSTIFSILFRTLTAGVSLILLLHAFRPQNRWAIVLFSIFWLAYFVRLLITTALDPESVKRSIDFYWIWSFGACFLPSLAVFGVGNSAAAMRLSNQLLIFTVSALALAIIFGGTGWMATNGTIHDINRLNVESLNPISMGHLGVTGVLLGICLVLQINKRRDLKMLAIAAIILGIIIAILANSRGPLLALATSIGVLIFARGRRRSTFVFGALVVMILFFSAYYQRDAIFSETGLIYRFQAIFGGLDASTYGRLNSFQGAFDQFLESPLFGDAIEERTTKFYPHNVVLEALMSTGIVGGFPFILMLLWALKRGWTLVRQGSDQMWVGLLTVQYIVSGMFSGAIYTSNTLWIVVALALSVPLGHSQRLVIGARIGQIHDRPWPTKDPV